MNCCVLCNTNGFGSQYRQHILYVCVGVKFQNEIFATVTFTFFGFHHYSLIWQLRFILFFFVLLLLLLLFWFIVSFVLVDYISSWFTPFFIQIQHTSSSSQWIAVVCFTYPENSVNCLIAFLNLYDFADILRMFHVPSVFYMFLLFEWRFEINGVKTDILTCMHLIVVVIVVVVVTDIFWIFPLHCICTMNDERWMR